MKRIATLAAVLITSLGAFGLLAAAESRLAVKHDHLVGSCEGQLIFTDSGVQYETEKAKHARHWNYVDIQQLGVEPTQVVVLTYRDRLLHLGRDERFTFDVIEGEVKDSLRAYLEEKLTRPLVSSVLPAETPAEYRISVKHRKALSGTEGVLEFSDRYVIYRTKDQRDARIWRYNELLSIGSTGPYQLRVTAMERTGGEYGGGKNFVFDLKEKLPEKAYDYVWNKINRPRIDGVSPEAASASPSRVDTAEKR